MPTDRRKKPITLWAKPFRHPVAFAREIFELLHVLDYLILALGTGAAGLIWKYATQYAEVFGSIPPIYVAVTTVILFCSAAALVVRLVITRRDLKRIQSGEAKIVGEMVQISLMNAGCDQQLFDNFCDCVQSRQAKEVAALSPDAVKAARQIVMQNMVHVLDHTAKVMRFYTGYVCAVSIKRPTQNLMLATLARDSFSGALRGTVDDEPHPISGNSASDEIYNHNKPFYVENDLIAASAQNLYKNSRGGWDKDYTAVVAVPIYYNDAGHKHWPVPSIQGRPLGLLCVDSMYADFDEGLCVNYLRSVCWRLSVMIYRWDVLSNWEKAS